MQKVQVKRGVYVQKPDKKDRKDIAIAKTWKWLKKYEMGLIDGKQSESDRKSLEGQAYHLLIDLLTILRT